MLSPKRARAPPAPETPPMSPSPSTLQAVPALALTTTFADLPNDCIIDILSFVGTPSSSPSAAGEAFRDLGRALCAAPWLRELGVHAWAAAVRRRWPAWAAIADAARVKRAVAEPSMGKAEEIAWRRQAELFELREREELAIAPLAGGAIAKRQTVVQPRHRAVLAEWLAEVRKVMERAIKSQIGRTDELGQREVERSRRASRGARAFFCCSLRRRAWRFCERIAALEIVRDERHRAGAIRPRMRESCLLFSRSVRIKKLEDGEIAALTRTLAFASRFRSSLSLLRFHNARPAAPAAGLRPRGVVQDHSNCFFFVVEGHRRRLCSSSLDDERSSISLRSLVGRRRGGIGRLRVPFAGHPRQVLRDERRECFF